VSHDSGAHGGVERRHRCSHDLAAYPVFDAEREVFVWGDGTVVDISGGESLDAGDGLV